MRNQKLVKQIQNQLQNSKNVKLDSDIKHTAVLLLLHIKDDELNILFQKRNKNIRQGGEVSFPGGKKSDTLDTTLLDTALRETEEESGISRDQIKILGHIKTIYNPMGFLVESYVGYVNNLNEKNLLSNIDEVDYHFSVPLKFFLRTKPHEYKALVQILPEYLDEQGKKIKLLPAQELGLPE